MTGLERASIIIALIREMRESGSWCGETHIQKITYFLQTMLEVPLEFRFILYKHGPFSFGLRDELTGMLADEILKLESRPYPYGPSFSVGVTAQCIIPRF